MVFTESRHRLGGGAGRPVLTTPDSAVLKLKELLAVVDRRGNRQ